MNKSKKKKCVGNPGIQYVHHVEAKLIPKTLVLAVALACAHANAATMTWDSNSNGSHRNEWSAKQNWTGNVTPSFHDTVIINGGKNTPTLDANVRIGSLQYLAIPGGNLNLDGKTLTIENDYNSNFFFNAQNIFNRYRNVTTDGGAINASTTSGTNWNALRFQQLSVDNGVNKTFSATGTTLALGNIHVGSSVSKDYLIYDMAGTGGVTLRGAIQSTGLNSQLSGSGVVNSAWTAFNTGVGETRTVTFAGTSAGALSGQKVNILNNFANTNQQTLSITGAAYNLASARTNATPLAANPRPLDVTIAAQRVGGTNAQALTVSNTAPTGNYSERLDASFGNITGAARNNGGAVSWLAPGSSSTALSVGVDTSSGGAKNGSVALNYVSNGRGTSGLGNTTLGTQAVNVSGNVYQSAAASGSPVRFGIVHVGDTASKGVATNTSPVAGLNDTLRGSVSVSGTGFSGSGNFTGLAAGETDANTRVTLNTAVAGSYSGTATLDHLASHNAEITDLALHSQSVTLTGQVNNYANAAFGKTAGVGTLSGTGASYVLNFGTITNGAGTTSANLFTMNSGGAASFTDMLTGTFITTGASPFTFSGPASITGLAGAATQGFQISLSNAHGGSFTQLLTLNYGGFNSGYTSTALGSINLELRANVLSPVPEPGTWAMLIAGLAVVSLRAKGMTAGGTKRDT